MKKFITALAAFALVGCASGNQRSDESSDSTLLDDESCNILYTMVQSCVELGEIERDAVRCETMGDELRPVFADTLQMDADFVDFIESYCVENCQKGIDGLARPRVEDVCL